MLGVPIDGGQERERGAGVPGEQGKLGAAQEQQSSRSVADAELQGRGASRRSAQRDAGRVADEPTLAQIAWTLLERRWTVIAVTGAVLALAVAYLFVAAPQYESSILIQVEGRTRPAAAFENVAPLFDRDTSGEGEIRIMKSRTLLDAVVGQLGLDVEARPRTLPIVGNALARRYQGPAPAPALFGLSRFAWGGERIRVERLTVSAALEGQPLVLTAMEAARYRVTAEDGTALVEGEVGKRATGTDGEHSIELLVSQLTARPGTQFWMIKRRRMDVVESLQANLQISEPGRNTGLAVVALGGPDPRRIAAILDAISANYLRLSVERTSAQAAKMLQLLEAQLPVLKSNMDKAETAVNAFRRRNGTLNLPVEAESMLTRIGEIDRSIADLELQMAESAVRHTERYPDASPLAERARRLREQRAAMESRMRALPNLDLESTRLSRQARVASELYLLVLNRAEELRIIKSGWLGDVRILEKAVVPHRSVSPKRTFVLTLGTLLGLGLGIAAALVRNALDEGVRDPDEIEAGTGLPVFATIPRSRAQRRIARRGRRGRLHALSAVEPGDAAVEDLRSLRTGVAFALLRATNNIVAVGSPAPRDGKSFVSVNLAHLLASADGRVLIVDGDLRRGVLHRYFGLESRPGLSDVLSGVATVEMAVHRTDDPNLDVLPAGDRVTNPADLLARVRFQQVVEDLARRYKIVIIDTPPILSVTDSALVGRHAGVNLLVLRAGEHTARDIALAVKRLVQNGITVRGAILNDVRQSFGRYGRSGRYRRYDPRPA